MTSISVGVNVDQMVKVVIPVAPAPAAEKLAAIAALGDKASGLRLGVLDNSKGNADHLLAFLLQNIKAEVPIASVSMQRKSNASERAPKDVIDQLAKDADFVIMAMAD